MHDTHNDDATDWNAERRNMLCRIRHLCCGDETTMLKATRLPLWRLASVVQRCERHGSVASAVVSHSYACFMLGVAKHNNA